MKRLGRHAEALPWGIERVITESTLPLSLLGRKTTLRSQASELFARHLDLAPLRGRAKGKVHCIFHRPDRTPSLSIDLEGGRFHCFSCLVGGGLRRFAELVGESLDVKTKRPTSLGRVRSPLDEARAGVLREARRQPWALPGVRDLYRVSDWIRLARQQIDYVRQAATAAGPTEAAWRTLTLTAETERDVERVEAALDELLALDAVAVLHSMVQ